MDMIKAFYYGQPNPCDSFFPDKNTYSKMLNEHEQQCKAFEDELMKIDPEFKKRFRRLMENGAGINYLETDEMFVHGFRYGALMMLDILKLTNNEHMSKGH